MERQYKILWKEDFVSFLKDSPYFATSKNIKSDQTVRCYTPGWDPHLPLLLFQNNDSVQKTKEKPNYCWNLMPPELKPNFKRTGAGTTKLGSTAKPALVRRIRPGLSVDEKLKLLEEKEKQGATPLDPKKIKKEPGDLEEDDEEMDEGGVEDDEMDDENDYGNSYFDNGEAFNDEDDNLDDGPVY